MPFDCLRCGKDHNTDDCVETLKKRITVLEKALEEQRVHLNQLNGAVRKSLGLIEKLKDLVMKAVQ